MGNVLKLVNFMIMVLLMYFFGCEVNFLVWNSVVCSFVMVIKEFWKFVVGYFDRNILWKKVKFESRVSIYFSKGIIMLFL